MRVDFPEPRWAVPGLLAEGANLLIGTPKIGKSWMALGLGLSVACGALALGQVKCEKGDVLYLALEDTGRRLQSRLGMVLSGIKAPANFTLETSCPRLSEGGAAYIETWIRAHPNARLIIVDVLTRLRSHADSRRSHYEVDYEAMTAVKDIADEWGVSILVVHHSRKQTSEDFLDMVSGTHGLAGASDAILVLERARQTGLAMLKLTGRDIEEAEHPVSFDKHIGTWTLLDGAGEDYNLSEPRQRMKRLVKEEGPLTPTQAASRLGITIAAAKQTLSRMFTDQQIERNGEGLYYL